MPLQNRVDPWGELHAVAARGTMMGNRGGRIHDEHRSLGARRWTSRRWICCELAFKGWWRPVMGRGYTELFFLDEVTALAAGHRPCFECRRAEAKAFAAAFSAGQGASSPSAQTQWMNGSTATGCRAGTSAITWPKPTRCHKVP